MHRFRIQCSIVLLAIAWSSISAIAQPRAQTDRVLARIGSTLITEQEFRHRFELLPGQGRGRENALSVAKREFLYSLVAEKILSTTAQSQGIEREPSMQASTELVRRLLARDELYRDEIQRKVTVSAGEITASLKLARRQREILYLHSEIRQVLDSLEKRMQRPADLRTASTRSTSVLLLDSLTVRWGEAEVELEAAAYQTPIGRVSRVVPSSVGWFLIGVLAESSDPDWMSLDTKSARTKIETTLRLRKEQQRLDVFTREVFRSLDGRAIRPSVVLLAEALRTVWNSSGCDTSCTVTEDNSRMALDLLGEHRNDTLTVMGERHLTIEEGLTKLRTTSVAIPSAQYPQLERSLSSILRTWVHQDLLESLAIERGLDGRPEIVAQIEMWRDHYLSEEMIRRVEKSTRFDDLDVYLYEQYLDPTKPMPVMAVRVATGPGLAEMARFLDEAQGLPLTAQLPFAPGVSVKDLSERPVSQLGLVASIAWRLRPGEWSRPTVVDSLVISVQLLELKEPSPKAASWDSAATFVRSQKVSHATADLIARLGQRLSVEVHEELVDKIDISPVPMMTYRILGFGGRMFAVPFVRPQSDWLNITPRTGEPAP